MSSYGEDHDLLLKLLLIGDSGVGKTTLMLKICDGYFTESHISTIGVDFKMRMVKTDDKLCKLQIWDTAGQERFRVITSSYYRGAHGIFICFDLSDPVTFANVTTCWEKEVLTHTGSPPVVMLLGLKSDLERAVSYEEASGLAEMKGWHYAELSSKEEAPETLEEKIFRPMIQQARTHWGDQLCAPKKKSNVYHPGTYSPSVHLASEHSSGSKKGCCGSG